jgi:hypothetical protein
VASASEEGDVVLWDVKSKTLVQRVPGHKGICFWVDVNGDTMASAGQDHKIRIYRKTVGKFAHANGVTDDTTAEADAPIDEEAAKEDQQQEEPMGEGGESSAPPEPPEPPQEMDVEMGGVPPEINGTSPAVQDVKVEEDA